MTTVIRIPTRHGHTVNVTAHPDNESRPYQWACTAGDASSDYAYTCLPFARNDATDHARACDRRPTFPGGGF